MKVTAILKGVKDDLGRMPVCIRLADGKRRSFQTTQIRVLPGQFNKGLVVDHPRARQFNEDIKRKIIDTEAKYYSGERSKYPDADFRTYLEKCLKQWKGEKSKATLQQFKTEGEKFLTWSGEIKLSKITLEKLNEYKGHLFSKYHQNTIAKSFKNLKTLLLKAKAERLIEYDPFDLFEKPQYRNPKRDYLTINQVNKIEEFSVDPKYPETLRNLATWFVIGCYTGLRHSDMVQFNKDEHIKAGRLVLETVKTKDIVGMPVKGKLQDLFDRVGWSGLSLSNQKSNEYLKEVAKAKDLPDNITMHVSRHTFAVRCADAGISPEVTAKLMGIKSLKTIAVYYKITNKRIDDELGKIFD
jgi:integrase/recombinase XerD